MYTGLLGALLTAHGAGCGDDAVPSSATSGGGAGSNGGQGGQSRSGAGAGGSAGQPHSAGGGQTPALGGAGANGGAVDIAEAGASSLGGATDRAGANGAGVAGGAPGHVAGGAGAAGEGGEPNDACPNVTEPELLSNVAIPALNEASGVAASRRVPGLLYTHNDSGAAARAYAFDESGRLIATLDLAGASAQDWEDVATGPGPEPGKSYLYFGDIGDNDRNRTTSIAVQRALEPSLSLSDENLALTLEYVTLFFRYPDEPHDAEALLVHPDTTDLYVVTKEPDGARVFVARAPHSATEVRTLELVTVLLLPLGAGSSLASGGDISPDGKRVLLRTSDSAYLFAAVAEASFEQAWFASPCAVTVPNDIQGEGISFAPDGLSYYALGEGPLPPLFRSTLDR